MKYVADLHSLTEAQRIEMIAAALGTGKSVGLLLEANDPGKLQRYLTKLRKIHPNVAAGEKTPMTDGVVLVRLTLPGLN